jgi:hypothetical protein
VSYVNSYGETLVSDASTTVTTTASQAFDVTLPVSSEPTVSARKLYRTIGGGPPSGPWYLVGTINNNTSTLYTDIVADTTATLPPGTSSAMSAQIVMGNIRFNNPWQSTGAAVTAAGTNQATATAIGLVQFNSVTAGANTGVLLPALNSHMIGMAILIFNLPGNTLAVYPSGAQTINGGASVTQAVSTGRWYVATSATTWLQI